MTVKNKLSLKLLDELIDDVSVPFKIFVSNIFDLTALLNQANIKGVKRKELIDEWHNNKGF
jgi:hypothetical protein